MNIIKIVLINGYNRNKIVYTVDRINLNIVNRIIYNKINKLYNTNYY